MLFKIFIAFEVRTKCTSMAYLDFVAQGDLSELCMSCFIV
jgi:hypothetical protein